MNVAIATTESDQLGGVFAGAYRAAGGAAPGLLLLMPERADLGFPSWAAAWAYWRILSLDGVARIAVARKLGQPLLRRDRELGLHRPWIETLAGPETRIVRCDTINGPTALAALRQFQPDVLVSIGVPVILRREVLAVPRIAALNVHNGRLPAYRGHFATFWEVARGEPWAYTSIHEMTPQVDAGQLVACARVAVGEVPSFLDLLAEKKRLGGALLARVLDTVARTGRLPDSERPASDAAASQSYFPWPSLADVRRFRWRPEPVAGTLAR